MKRRITKIKYKPGDFVTINWTAGEKHEDEYSIKCRDVPRGEFIRAMSELNRHVVEMCELPDIALYRVQTRSVSLNYGGENETLGATISAQMELLKSNQPLNINTPNKTVEPYNKDTPWDEKICLTEECTDAIYELIEEANLYIDGTRAQGSLFEAEKKAV